MRQLIVFLSLLFTLLSPTECFLHTHLSTPLRVTDRSRLRMEVNFMHDFFQRKHVRRVATTCIGFLSLIQVASARPEGVNRPDLLPKEQTSVIDVANFLSKGQEKKMISSIENLEKATGIKLRVLCQSYPNTPGLAIKEYWKVDDNTVLLVADRGEGFSRKGIPSNIINLNIGANVENIVSNQFWQRLSNKLGNQPYVKKNGEDVALLNAVEAITYCLEDKTCTDLPFAVDQP